MHVNHVASKGSGGCSVGIPVSSKNGVESIPVSKGGRGQVGVPLFHPPGGRRYPYLLSSVCSNSELREVCYHHSGPVISLNNGRTNNAEPWSRRSE